MDGYDFVVETVSREELRDVKHKDTALGSFAARERLGA